MGIVINKLLIGMLCTGLCSINCCGYANEFFSDFRQQLASVIEAHNKKTFSQFDDKFRDSPEQSLVENNIESQVCF
jgi:hypothetical protein